MAANHNVVHPRDVISVGSRVSWGAIGAGGTLAVAITVLLGPLGGAAGLSLSERVSEDNLRLAAIAWSILVMCIAAFAGGVVASVFTVGESKTEGMIYGILAWALALLLVFALGGVGVRNGFVTVIRIREFSQSPSEIDLAARISWYAFAGAWASMIAGALGGLIGAGPTFRIVTASPPERLM